MELDRWKEYAIPYSRTHHISMWYLGLDFALNFAIYRCTFRDYFCLDFPYWKRRAKRNFFLAKKSVAYYQRHNDPAQANILKDKEEALRIFEKFIGRDWCGQKYNSSRGEYEAFLEKHDLFILKPLRGMGGHGIEMMSTQRIKKEDVADYCKEKNAIIEELIVQHERLQELFPNSVNTVRIFTHKGECIGAVLRMGTGKSFVDNASSGGLYAPIDVERGVIIDGAYPFHPADPMYFHPDTGVIIPGFRIPYWEQCLEMVREAAQLLPGLPLIGWDIAISNEKPLIVEANARPEVLLLQNPSTKYGFRYPNKTGPMQYKNLE